MSKQRRIDLRLARWPKLAIIPLMAGCLWLYIIIINGIGATLVGALPAGLIFATGLSTLLWSGDRRTPQYQAIGALVGVLLMLPLWFMVGFWAGLLLFIAAVAAWFSAGWIAFRLDPVEADALTPKATIATTGGAALDEAFLCYTINTRPLPNVNEIDSIHSETIAAIEQYQANGWLDDPASFHQRPPALETVHFDSAEHRGQPLEFMSFTSEYEPHEHEPGRDRWLDYQSNRTAYATVYRHEDGLPRPWLVGIHGFQMGYPLIDSLVFDPKFLHEKLGLNVILPTLPMHGRRRTNTLSGDGFLAGNIMDTIHAEAQAQWDIRRILQWIQQQDATGISVLGYSLGGYNAALLSSLVKPEEATIASVTAAIPLADVPQIFWRHGPPHMLRYMDSLGANQNTAATAMQVVSPLAIDCLVPHDKRFMIAASADRVTPPEQTLQLWEHWDRPYIKWYQGSHLTVRHHHSTKDTILRALMAGNLLDDQHQPNMTLGSVSNTDPAENGDHAEIGQSDDTRQTHNKPFSDNFIL